jgi:hypothetical protein
LPGQGEGEEHDGEGEGEEGVIMVRVEEEEQEEDEEEGEEEREETQHHTSEEPSSFSGHMSNSLSSHGQLSCYPFTFHHLPGRGSTSSTGSPPFAFSCPTVTPHSKSMSTHASHKMHSMGNIGTTSLASLPSGSSPISAAPSSLLAPSPHEHMCGMPMPPHHPAAGTSSCQHVGGSAVVAVDGVENLKIVT